MADNVEITHGAGTTIATDEAEVNGGAKAQVQRVKPVWGVDGTATDTSATNPLPVKAEAGSQTKVTALEGEPKVKIAENAALVAGAAEIGKVKVTELPATPTGTNSIGKVKSIEEALPAGTNALGKVIITSLEGEPKVKVSALEGEPKVKAIGDVASGSADSGNPVKTSSVAQTTLPAATTAGNRINAQADKYGRALYTVAPPDRLVTGKALLENETSTEVIAAGGAAVRIMVTSILVTNASTTVSTRVEILDEATSKIIGHAVEKGGGFEITNPFGIFIGTANKPVKAKCITTGAKVDVFISGYQIPE